MNQDLRNIHDVACRLQPGHSSGLLAIEGSGFRIEHISDVACRLCPVPMHGSSEAETVATAPGHYLLCVCSWLLGPNLGLKDWGPEDFSHQLQGSGFQVQGTGCEAVLV